MRFYITSFLCLFCSCLSDKHGRSFGAGFLGILLGAAGLWILTRETVKDGHGAPVWLQGTFFRNLGIGLVIVGGLMVMA